MSLIQSARVPGSSVLDIFGDAAASTGSTAPPSPQQKTLASQIQSSEVPAPAERENDALSDATADAALAGDPTDSIKLEMWCRQHNPEFVKMQAQQKAQAAWDRAQALPVGSWIRIKTSSGIFQVQLVSHVEDTSSILVAFEDGRQMSYKATAILWPEPSAPAPTKRSWDGQSRAAPSLSKSRSGAPMPQLVSVPGPDGTLQYFYAVPLPPRQPHQHHNHTEMQPPSHMFPPSALPHGPPVGYWHPRHPQDFQHPQVTWAQPQVAGQHPQALPTSGLAPPSHTQGQSIGGPTHSMPLLPPQSATLPPSFSAPSSSSATQFGWPGSATLPHSPFMPPPQMPPPQPCHTPVEAATG